MRILRISLSFFIPFFLFSQELGWKKGDIAIVQWEKTPFQDGIRDSIIDVLPVEIDEYQLKGKVEKIYGIFGNISKKNYRLVVMIGAQIVTPILQYLPETPIIIIGASIDLDRIHKKFHNITGIYSFTSPTVQLYNILQLVKDVKKIGVIYNPLHSSVEVGMLERAITDTTISLIKNGVSNSNEIATALHFIKDIDLLWIPTDPIYRDRKAIKNMMDYSLKNNIPVFSPSIEFVRKGALASQLPSDVSLEILSIISSLEKGKNIQEVHPRFPSESLILNKKTAELLGIEIPERLLLTAEEVYE